MERSFIYFLIVLIFIHSVSYAGSIDISTPSNYTLQNLRSFRQKHISCKENKDCPFGSTCGSNDICVYGMFLCQDNEDIKCLYLNTEVYDPNNEELYVEYRNNKNINKFPILKTCNNTQAERGICTTDKCNGNSDCYSGLCKSGKCVIKESFIYLCKIKINKKDSDFSCGKQNQMYCTNNKECFDQRCNSKRFCENYEAHGFYDTYEILKPWKLIAIICIIIFTISICCLFCACFFSVI